MKEGLGERERVKGDRMRQCDKRLSVSSNEVEVGNEGKDEQKENKPIICMGSPTVRERKPRAVCSGADNLTPRPTHKHTQRHSVTAW